MADDLNPAAVERAARVLWEDSRQEYDYAWEGNAEAYRALARAALTAARAGESAQVDAGAAGATHPAHWERHGHPGEPCPPYGCAARAEPAPTVSADDLDMAVSNAIPDDLPGYRQRYTDRAVANVTRLLRGVGVNVTEPTP